jgi:hypothetical protein
MIVCDSKLVLGFRDAALTGSYSSYGFKGMTMDVPVTDTEDAV